MPDTPTPGVNGQVLSAPALQSSMSMLSFAPAARTRLSLASTATAGSFCLFCENGPGGEPALTRTSCAAAGAATAPQAITARPSAIVLRMRNAHLPGCG